MLLFKYMDKNTIFLNLDALHTLYPKHIKGGIHALPQSNLNGLPIWIKGAVRVFILKLQDEPQEPFLYLVKPEQEMTFEHLMRIYRQLKETLQEPVLMIADNLPSKHRPLLVKFNIAFIYKNEAVYAPQLGLKFDRISRFKEDRTINVENKNETMTPFGVKLMAGLLTNQISQDFTLKSLHEKIQQNGIEVSITKLSLTLKQLVENGLLLARGAGPRKCFMKAETEKTWDKLLSLPLAPFFREVETNYIPKNRETFCHAGETALAQYSNLAIGTKETIAMSVKEFRESYEGKKVEISLGEVHTTNMIQIWKEPPHLFSIQKALNPVELFFSMRKHPDERVQMSLDEMLKPYKLIRKEK